jgi:hypothetical protein
MFRIQHLLVTVLVGFACCGCAGFRGELLPQLSRSEITSENRLPAISYECKIGPGPNATGGDNLWPGSSAEWLFRSAFVDARNGPAANDLHIDLFFQTEARQPSFTLGLALLTICSLGIIPAYGREDLTLRARVEYQGRLAREYTYGDRIEIWIHLFMIPWSFSHDPVEVERAVHENLLLHFLRDLRKDLPQITSPG